MAVTITFFKAYNLKDKSPIGVDDNEISGEKNASLTKIAVWLLTISSCKLVTVKKIIYHILSGKSLQRSF